MIENIQDNITDKLYTDPALGAVLTVKEVEHLFGVSRRQIQWAIWRDQIEARLTLNNGVWLIALSSCIKMWGKPSRTLESELLNNVK